MKIARIVAIVVVILCTIITSTIIVSTFIVQLGPTNNMIRNGGFEEDFANWVNSPYCNNKIVTSPVHSGSKAISLGKGETSGYVVQYVDIEFQPNTTYYYSFFYKTFNDQTYFVVNTYNGEQKVEYFPPSNGEWKEARGSFSFTGNSYTLQFSVGVYGSETGIVDDVYLGTK
jgi:hypothetical protein